MKRLISFPGKYACQITPRSHAPCQEISVLDTSIRLYVTVLPQKGQPELKSQPISLPFLPPIFTHNAEIHLSTLTPLSSLRISAVSSLSDQIQVCFLFQQLDINSVICFLSGAQWLSGRVHDS